MIWFLTVTCSGSGFEKGDERSSSQYPLFRFVAPATNDYSVALPCGGSVGEIAGLIQRHVSFQRQAARNFRRLGILAI